MHRLLEVDILFWVSKYSIPQVQWTKTMCMNVHYNTQKAIKRHHNKDMENKREMHVQ